MAAAFILYVINEHFTQELILRTIKGIDSFPEGHWLKQFHEALKSDDLSDVSVRGYLYDLIYFRNWLIGVHGQEVALKRISAAGLTAYRQHLVEDKGMKSAAVNRRIQSVKKLFAWAHSLALIGENPARHLRFMKPDARRQPKGLNERELHALLIAAGKSSHGMGKRNYTLIQLMVHTGIRVSEAARIKVEDLTIHERSGWIQIIAGRGLEARRVPLNATVRRALNAYLNTSSDRSPGDLLFLTKRGQPASVRTLQRTITVLAQRAKIERIKVSANTLRHTFVHNYLKAHPGELEALAELLGNTDPHSVTVYTRPEEEDSDERG
jgi:site-specific recombinase XerD